MLLFIKHNHCHHHRVLGFFVVIAILYTSIGTGLGIGISRGQYYWVLDIGSLSWYRSNPNHIAFRKRIYRHFSKFSSLLAAVFTGTAAIASCVP